MGRYSKLEIFFGIFRKKVESSGMAKIQIFLNIYFQRCNIVHRIQSHLSLIISIIILIIRNIIIIVIAFIFFNMHRVVLYLSYTSLAILFRLRRHTHFHPRLFFPIAFNRIEEYEKALFFYTRV